MQPDRQFERSQRGSTAVYGGAVRESALATNKVLKNTKAGYLFNYLMPVASIFEQRPMTCFSLVLALCSSPTQLALFLICARP